MATTNTEWQTDQTHVYTHAHTHSHTHSNIFLNLCLEFYYLEGLCCVRINLAHSTHTYIYISMYCTYLLRACNCCICVPVSHFICVGYHVRPPSLLCNILSSCSARRWRESWAPFFPSLLPWQQSVSPRERPSSLSFAQLPGTCCANADT